MLSVDELNMHIRGCALNNRESQKKIYNSFYGYCMAICDRYTNNQDDAVEILNDGFLKIFKEVHRYKPAYADEMRMAVNFLFNKKNVSITGGVSIRINKGNNAGLKIRTAAIVITISINWLIICCTPFTI